MIIIKKMKTGISQIVARIIPEKLPPIFEDNKIVSLNVHKSLHHFLNLRAVGKIYRYTCFRGRAKCTLFGHKGGGGRKRPNPNKSKPTLPNLTSNHKHCCVLQNIHRIDSSFSMGLSNRNSQPCPAIRIEGMCGQN